MEEARQLAELAKSKGVVAVVSTQACAALEIEHLKQLIANDYVGTVLSTSIIGRINGNVQALIGKAAKSAY